MNQANIEIEILINIIPIIIINSLIAIIVFIIMSFIILSIQNKVLNFKNISIFKEKIIYLFFGFIVIIFLIINQIIFYELFNIPELNNINELIGEEIIQIRDTFLSIFVFLLQLFFILAFSLKVSLFSSLIPFVFIILLQFLIPISDINFFIESNIIKISLFLITSIVFLFFARLFFKQKSTVIYFFLFFLVPIFFISNLIVDFSFFGKVNNLSVFSIIFVLTIIYFFLLYIINGKIFTSIYGTNLLKQSIMFDNNNFVNFSFSENYFKNWVITNKVDQGTFILLKFSNEKIAKRFLKDKVIRIIYKKFLTIIVENFKKDFIFLRGLNGEYYFFTKNNDIRKINNKINFLFEKLPNNFILKGKKFPLLFKFYGVQYGKSANNFNELVNCLDESSKNKGVNNKRHLIMYSFIQKNFIKNNDYKKLTQKIRVDSIRVRLLSTKNIWFPKIIINNKTLKDVNEILIEIDNLEIKELLIRHIAYLTLEQFYFKKGIINVMFLSSIIESNFFDFSDFIRTIDNIGIKYKDIRLIFVDRNPDENNENYKNIINSGIII